MSFTKRITTQEESLIFLHIPKTGGTTLNTIINRHFPQNAIWNINKRNIGELKRLSEEERLAIRCLEGHLVFGIHELLPQACTYITLLRNPVDRIISHYYFARRNPNNYLYDEATSMSLKDYARHEELSNGQTRRISGFIGIDSATSPGNPSKMLETAKRNLEVHFKVVGISERFNEVLVLLKRFLGWRNVFYVKVNIAKDRPSVTDIPQDTLRVIETYNELDMELYDYAKHMLEKLIGQQDSSFKRELRNFELCNKLYQKGYGGAGKVYSLRHKI